MLTSFDPRTGEVAGDFAIMGADELTRTLREARSAQAWWGALGSSARKRWLLDWKKRIARQVGSLADVVVQETGKPHADALFEVMAAVEHLDWAARNAGRVLDRRRISAGRSTSGSLGYEPLGVVGVIGPSSYPVFSPMTAVAYAMAAGNAVVLKPSDLTPGVGMWLAESWTKLAPSQPVLQVVTGDASTGEALCRSRVDKVAFVGASETARSVMAACAESLTPVVVEGGGNDAMVVAVDAVLEDAAEAAVTGAMANAGQTCVAVERVYVADSVYDEFLELVATKARSLRSGADGGASYGPMTRPEQVDIVRSQVQAALDAGAKAVVGSLDSIREPYVSPIVLTDVPEDAAVVAQETFGPVVVVNKVRDLSEAISRANATPYGLGASVFTRDVRIANWVAAQLRAGAVSINSVGSYMTVPGLPFGGVGDSGFGRLAGDDGFREFARAKAITRRRSGPASAFALDRSPRQRRIATLLFKAKHVR